MSLSQRKKILFSTIAAHCRNSLSALVNWKKFLNFRTCSPSVFGLQLQLVSVTKPNGEAPEHTFPAKMWTWPEHPHVHDYGFHGYLRLWAWQIRPCRTHILGHRYECATSSSQIFVGRHSAHTYSTQDAATDCRRYCGCGFNNSTIYWLKLVVLRAGARVPGTT